LFCFAGIGIYKIVFPNRPDRRLRRGRPAPSRSRVKRRSVKRKGGARSCVRRSTAAAAAAATAVGTSVAAGAGTCTAHDRRGVQCLRRRSVFASCTRPSSERTVRAIHPTNIIITIITTITINIRSNYNACSRTAPCRRRFPACRRDGAQDAHQVDQRTRREGVPPERAGRHRYGITM